MFSKSAPSRITPPLQITTAKPTFSNRPLLLCVSLGVLLILLVFLIGATQGAYPLNPIQGLQGQWSVQEAMVFNEIRLPRLLLSLFVGAGLSISGAVLQALLRNPLADPQIIGISSGATVAVGGCLLLGPTAYQLFGHFTLPIAAFLGGLSVCTLMLSIAQGRRGFDPSQLILIGVAINAIAAAAIGLIQYLSDDQQLRSFAFWMLGSLSGALWWQVGLVSILVTLGLAILLRQHRGLDLLALGEAEAEYAGIDTQRLKSQAVIAVALMVGISVAFTGIIAFVGLIIPHIVRKLLGASQQILLPMSAILGAVFLMLADTCARTWLNPEELPIGILTSLMGGPFFLWLLTRKGELQ
jgi:iron complex transport system permease protein